MMMGPTYQEGGGDAESELHDALLLLLLLADWPESWICEPFLFRAQLVATTIPRTRLLLLPSISRFFDVPFRQSVMMAQVGIFPGKWNISYQI
jgi:hypothetical protein